MKALFAAVAAFLFLPPVLLPGAQARTRKRRRARPSGRARSSMPLPTRRWPVRSSPWATRPSLTDEQGRYRVAGGNLPLKVRAAGYTRVTAATEAGTPPAIKLTPLAPKALYLTVYGIGAPFLRDPALDVMQKSGLNALVIDLKGDRGLIPYPSALPLAAKNGALKVRTIPDLKELVTTLKAKGIYLIARVVVFKDNLLVSVHPEWAVRLGGGIWKDREGLSLDRSVPQGGVGLYAGRRRGGGRRRLRRDPVRLCAVPRRRRPRLLAAHDRGLAGGDHHRLPARGAAAARAVQCLRLRWNLRLRLLEPERHRDRPACRGPGDGGGRTSRPCSIRRASSSAFPATAIPSRIPTRSSTSRWKSANDGRPGRRCTTGPGCRRFPTMPSADKSSAPTRSASRSRRRDDARHRSAGCCGIRATSTRPMTSSRKRGRTVGASRHRAPLRGEELLRSCCCSASPARPSSPARRRHHARRRRTVDAARTAAAISDIVNEEIAAGHLPGAVVVLGIGDRIVLRQAYGQRALMPDTRPTRIDTIYDAASLTKVMATAIAIEQLVERGQIDLDRPAAAYWPAFAANGKGAITVRELMTHYAGLPAGIPTRGWSGSEGALQAIDGAAAGGAGRHALQLQRRRFHRAGRDRATASRARRWTSMRPSTSSSRSACATPPSCRRPACSDRIAPADVEGGDLRWGEVQDPIAYRMGGVAGHAGVFTTADDLTKLAQMMLAGGKNVLKPASVAAMTTPQSPPGGAALRGLGWDIDSPYRCGSRPPSRRAPTAIPAIPARRSGSTPRRSTFLIVLTNRLHPDGKGDILPMLRRIAEVAGAAARGGRPAQVLSGIDVLEAYGFRQLSGRRVGLITNRSARDLQGRRTADVLHQAAGPQLVALFSPEHGLEASAEGRIAFGPRQRDRPAGVQPLRQDDAAHLRHAGRARRAGLRHAGRGHALLHLSHDHGLCDGGGGARQGRLLRARPARPHHRLDRAGRRCSTPISSPSSPTCRCRCATA